MEDVKQKVIALRHSLAEKVLADVADEKPTSIIMAYVKPDGEVTVSGALRQEDDGFGLIGAMEFIKQWVVSELQQRD